MDTVSFGLRFKMAEPNEMEGGCEVGFFYYDWAQSRYRWTNDNRFDNCKVKKVEPSALEGKVGDKCKRLHVLRCSHDHSL